MVMEKLPFYEGCAGQEVQKWERCFAEPAGPVTVSHSTEPVFMVSL